MSTPEGKVKDAIRELLPKYKIYPAKDAGAFPEDAEGWYYMPPQMSSFGVKGIPDFVGTYTSIGIFWAIEAKAPGKKPTGFQELQVNAIRTAGGNCFVVDGQETLDVFEQWLKDVQEDDWEEKY